MESKWTILTVFPICRLDSNGISNKIFEPLVVNFIIIFMLIHSIKKFVRGILKSSKTEFGRNHHIGVRVKVCHCNLAFTLSPCDFQK